MADDDGRGSPAAFLTRIITKILEEKDTKKSSNAKLKAACTEALGKLTTRHSDGLSSQPLSCFGGVP